MQLLHCSLSLIHKRHELTAKSMKHFLILLSFLIISEIIKAQETTTDSIKTQELGEIIVEASQIIRKADMDVYFPSNGVRGNSKNGIQLLANLMIPSLSVNEALGTIHAAGQSVQVRINGRESSIEHVRALLPESIKRVEWIDNPGLRYNGANYVLNFIVSNPTSGGSFMFDGMQALNAAWGPYFASAKFNTGRSQWDIGAVYKIANKIRSHRDYYETFTYHDGTTVERHEEPLDGYMDYNSGSAWVSYNYVKPDTTIFMVEFQMPYMFSNRSHYHGLMSVNNQTEQIVLTDSHGDNGTTPSLSAYLQQNFKRKQMLIVSFNSSIYIGRAFSDYIEQPYREIVTSELLTDIHTNIKDHNQAYAIEANYIKNWNKGRFTTGVSYIANRNRSQYENLNNQIFHQKQNRYYVFAEYFHRFDKWTTTAGMGVQYTDFIFKETNQGNHSWKPRPQATITYSINQNHNFRLNITSWQSAPSLAETNIVPQQLDGFQWRIGNQNLETANVYMFSFRYGFNVPRISGTFGIRGYTSPNAIAPILRWENEKLITTYENSHGHRYLSLYIAPQIDIIPKWLSASGYVQYRMERMHGTGYKITNNSWCGNASLRLTHWGFVFGAQYMHAQRNIIGEKLSWDEDLNIIDLNYNWKGWQFGTGCIMPFGKYDRGSMSMSRWNKNEKHIRLNMRIPYISIRYNLQWGRQKRDIQKLISTDSTIEKSTATGR